MAFLNLEMPSGLWVYLRYEDPGFKTLPFSVEEKGTIETRLTSNCLRCVYVVLEIGLRASLVFYKDDKVQIQGPVHTRQTFHPEAKPQPQRGLLRITEFTPICPHHCHSWNCKKLWTRGRGTSPSPAAHHSSPFFTEETMRKRASGSSKESWMWRPADHPREWKQED